MSPRTTQLLHHGGDIAGFLDVCAIAHESCRFGGKAGTATLSVRGFGDRLAGGLGPAHPAPPGDLLQGDLALDSEAQRQRCGGGRHAGSVARFALRRLGRRVKVGVASGDRFVEALEADVGVSAMLVMDRGGDRVRVGKLEASPLAHRGSAAR